MTQPGPIQSMLRGAAAGITATTAMTGFMAAGQKVGALGRMPPSKIVDAALEGAGVAHSVSRTEHRALSGLAHYAFGIGAGALFGLLYSQTRRVPVPAPVQGAVFATGVWLASYAGWIPALGIMPAPERDRPGRPTTMLLAHWVYGATLGESLSG